LKEKSNNEMDTLFVIDKSANDILNTLKTSIQYNRNPQIAPILIKLQNSVVEETKFYHSYIMQDSPAIPDTIWKIRDDKDTTSLGYNYIKFKEFMDKAVKYRISLIPLINNVEKEIVNFRNMEKGLLIYHYGFADTVRIRNQYIAELDSATHKVIRDLNLTISENNKRVKKYQDETIVEIKKTFNIALITIAIGVIVSIVFLLPVGAGKVDKKKNNDNETKIQKAEDKRTTENVEIEQKIPEVKNKINNDVKNDETTLSKPTDANLPTPKLDNFSEDNNDEMKELDIELPTVPEEIIIDESQIDDKKYEEEILSLDDEDEYKPK
jgi:hypothetical protein